MLRIVVLALLLLPVGAAEATVPPETYKRLKALDDTLNRIHDGVKNQNLDAPLAGVIDKAFAEITAVGKTFPSIGSNPKVRNFAQVQRAASNVDLFLEDAIANVGDVQRRINSFGEAERQAKDLEDALRHADKPGQKSKAVVEAEALRALMRGVKKEVADPNFSKDGLVEEIQAVVKQKGQVLGKLPTVFGLKFITVFLPLERIEIALANANVAPTAKGVIARLDEALDAKLGLVQTLAGVTSCTIEGSGNIKGTGGSDVICGGGRKDTINAAGGVDLIKSGGGADAVKGGAGLDTIIGGNGNDNLGGGAGGDTLLGGKGRDTMNGGAGRDELVGGPGKDILIGGAGEDSCGGGKGDIKARCGKGPSCEAGSYTSPEHEITVPAASESKLEWFDTPILNHDYYRRRGFDSGGCDYSAGQFLARIDVLGGGKTIAWTYDLEPVGGGPPTGRDVHSADWCPAPRPPDNEVRNTCHIFRPQLGFPGPDGSDASRLKTYSVAVSYQALGGGEGVKASISVRVSWRLR